MRAYLDHNQGLYQQSFEKDACGIAVVCNPGSPPTKGIVDLALDALTSMSHRGATLGDGKTGDGAGMLLSIPHDFFTDIAHELAVTLPPAGQYAVGMIMTDKDSYTSGSLERLLAETLIKHQFSLIALRKVPVDQIAIGATAIECEPIHWQVLIDWDMDTVKTPDVQKRLYKIRRELEKRTGNADHFYISSLSTKTIVYKGMLLPALFKAYFPDFSHPKFTSNVAMVHSRFSTNTFPSWKLAHPFRTICHNGEINTIRGNLSWFSAREKILAKEIFSSGSDDLLPLIEPNQSDSASLDQALELLLLTGASPAEALMILMPEAFEKNNWVQKNVRSFYDYHAAHMEPWDGPAAVIAFNGEELAVALDRNGLRPCKIATYHDGTVVIASEAGVINSESRSLKSLERLGPGGIISINLDSGLTLRDQTVKNRIASMKNYGELLSRRILPSDTETIVLGHKTSARYSESEMLALHARFRYTDEDLESILRPMSVLGEEPLSSMGDDLPPAVLREDHVSLFDYFRQKFAQVTNPAIDPIREDQVMDLSQWIGRRGSMLIPTVDEALLLLPEPVLSDKQLDIILAEVGLKTERLSSVFVDNGTEQSLKKAVAALQEKAVLAVRNGANILLISDRHATEGMIIPMLLAVAATREALIERGLGTFADIIVESAEVRSVHHIACLLGYGARAICPWLTLASIDHLPTVQAHKENTPKKETYINACHKGLLKIMSKMGISTLRSYCGAGVFEALGIDEGLLAEFFPGTPSPLGGIGLKEIFEDQLRVLNDYRNQLSSNGKRLRSRTIHFRNDGGSRGWEPNAIAGLRTAAFKNDIESYQLFVNSADRIGHKPAFLRHLLAFNTTNAHHNITHVETPVSIVARFNTGAMSYGAISKEAHENLAIAMNHIGGKSNSGEGGEDASRARSIDTETSKASAIRQVASGRFGVTIEYLTHAKEIQIKIAQGAKPGEGGQLPGHKVDEDIASLRHCLPGVTLISPPPHHDIYSIEDLAQLIFDLNATNDSARISVKLVSSSGIGAIAAGVVKAGAGKVVISCGSGGTGASPLSSIKHAGMPWEIGLSEVHQTLVKNGLRKNVCLEVDGQLKTGSDVVKAALLGANEYGFATAPLIAQGCILMRKCHLNACPVGIATQDKTLREKFVGKPEYVINYFFMVAEDTRKHLASIGLNSLDEAIGRTDLLMPSVPRHHPKAATLKLSRLLYRESDRTSHSIPKYQPKELDTLMLESITNGTNICTFPIKLTNADRAVGAWLSGKMQKLQPNRLAANGPHTIHFQGAAGQSFGAFLHKKLDFVLTGFANDYVGKGLSGGKITIKSQLVNNLDGARKLDIPQAIVGNTVLYGATSGELYVNGQAGERFAVRNSGATAVVEGVGDHGCEYMTGGTVVILGPTGRNFAAGMSGGEVFVLDGDGFFNLRCNLNMVTLDRLNLGELVDEASKLRLLIERHLHFTGSIVAQRILNEWYEYVERFVVVRPRQVERDVSPAPKKRMIRLRRKISEATHG